MRGRKARDLKERFWEKVSFGFGEDACWTWLGGTRNGYGRIYCHENRSLLSAHRLSWEFHNEKIPNGKKVLHYCDNPSCVNPNHLFLGTQADNVLDMCNKGRQVGPKGSKAHTSLLEFEDVRDIRFLRSSGDYSYNQLASLFGVSKGCISGIINKRSWSWVK